jgi:hypothetical protein
VRIIILNRAQKQKDNASQRSNIIIIIITIPGYLLRNSLQLPANLLLGAPTNISAKAIKAYSGAASGQKLHHLYISATPTLSMCSDDQRS